MQHLYLALQQVLDHLPPRYPRGVIHCGEVQRREQAIGVSER